MAQATDLFYLGGDGRGAAPPLPGGGRTMADRQHGGVAARRRGLGEAALDARAVVSAYARWAPVYDYVFGPIMEDSRRAAVAALPGDAVRVLEVGVGTGISLPEYPAGRRVTGIDLSPDMLARARRRLEDRRLAATVDGLFEMDAAAMAFPDASFDAVMAMYVMTVVPDPARVMSEMRRVVRPGGRILAVSHFAPDAGPRRVVASAFGPLWRWLGWNTSVTVSRLAALPGVRLVAEEPAGLGGFYRLIVFERID
jgi:phosphatidylethanolamine/phosphatidyl-N-methylethanolamine N-methyltransferase